MTISALIGWVVIPLAMKGSLKKLAQAHDNPALRRMLRWQSFWMCTCAAVVTTGDLWFHARVWVVVITGGFMLVHLMGAIAPDSLMPVEFRAKSLRGEKFSVDDVKRFKEESKRPG
jgi:hypothetical protein